MLQPTQVLLLAMEPAIQNLVEQVCLIDGYTLITAATVEEARRRIAQGGKDVFALAVIDTAVLGVVDQQQQRLAYHLWQDWSAAYRGLPLVFVGTRYQNDAFLKNGSDNVGFLEKPLGPYAFANMMRTLLPERW